MINKNVIDDAYPIHRIDDQIDSMCGSAWFTTLDLTKGYHQMNLDISSREYTAFTTPMGLYQWKVLPMGMKTSGAIFQRLMDSVLGNLQPKIAEVYIDNITIFSPTLEQHYEDVNRVLERLDVANLKVNVNKCAFACEEIVVLGFKVSKDGINPNPAKVQGINDLKPPKNISRVKQILGMFNFYQKFIPNFAMLAEPIVELTRGK